MEHEFWHDRWQQNQIGFHRSDINPHLVEFWGLLSNANRSGLEKGGRVFVPLCGKSLDLLWLAEHGYEVIGVELSELAVSAFFEENDLEPAKTTIGELVKWQSGSVTIFQGDFFALSREILGKIDAVYDRASLIALPPVMRPDYAKKLLELCPGSPKLLITLEYSQDKMQGPPFSVTEDEIKQLYQGEYQLKSCLVQNVLDESPRFKENGLDYLKECVYLLQPQAE